MYKKIFITLLIIVLLPVNSIFAVEKNATIVNSTRELNRISESLQLNIKSILSNNYDKDEIEKILNYNISSINTIYNNLNIANTSEPGLITKKDYSTISYIASLFKLSINNLLLYLDNPKETKYLFESIGNYQTGSNVLFEFKNYVNTNYTR